jgi:hypothetical protein
MKNEIKFTEEDDNKILTAFSYGLNIQEVCFETGFDYHTVQSWLTKDDNMKRSELFTKKPVIDAKKTLTDKLKTDEKTAQWYLTHNKESKKDWSDRIEHTGADGEPLPVLVKFI